MLVLMILIEIINIVQPTPVAVKLPHWSAIRTGYPGISKAALPLRDNRPAPCTLAPHMACLFGSSPAIEFRWHSCVP